MPIEVVRPCRIVAIIVVALVVKRVDFDQLSCSTPDPVDTRTGDCPRAGKPFGYITSQLGQLSLPSLWVHRSVPLAHCVRWYR